MSASNSSAGQAVRARHRPLWETSVLTAIAAAYFVVFRQVPPHGDALRIVSQIDDGQLIWNPNHLLLDPLGYALFELVEYLDLASWEVEHYFIAISVVSASASLFVFDRLVCWTGVSQRWRLAAFGGFFATASFIGFGGSQYYIMIQMPFVLAAIHHYFRYASSSKQGCSNLNRLFYVGLLLGIAAAFMFHNVVAIAAMGCLAAWDAEMLRRPFSAWTRAGAVWLGAASVGLPIFISGHVASGSDSGLFQWVLAYAGESDSRLNEFYGLKVTLPRLMEGVARTGFKLLVGNLVEPAGVGTLVWVVLTGQNLEFQPQWLRIIASALVIPVALLVSIWVYAFIGLNFARFYIAKFAGVWLFSYAAFNFLWDSHDPSFWISAVPAFWLTLVMGMSGISVPGLIDRGSLSQRPKRSRSIVYLSVFVLALLIVNTWNLVIPQADPNFRVHQHQRSNFLKAGDVEIIPGWDQRWFSLDGVSPMIERISLMSMALAERGDPNEISNLPQIIDTRLSDGRRVLIARLYDLDGEIMPWYSLSRLGWSRDKIQRQLSVFCHRVAFTIDDVVFHEIYHCD